jgi:inner membrane protein involved in colicin E2 resistance
MGGYKRVFGIAFIWLIATVGWMVLGGVTTNRKETQETKLRDGVQSLWGRPQVQDAPQLTFSWSTQESKQRTEQQNGVTTQVSENVTVWHEEALRADSTHVDVDLRSDLRRKGLMWYSLYDVLFSARYGYEHVREEPGTLLVRFAFPDPNAIYDRFQFVVNGKDYSGELDASNGSVVARVPIAKGQRAQIGLRYQSRGLDSWTYRPTQGVARLRDFELNMRTHFADIDFPVQTLSPSSRARSGDGWKLQWKFEQIVSGFGIGMITPQRLQPGELASALAFSAPISLFFFFLVIYVLATLRRIDIHPINYYFVSGAFFAFHLLFAYTADHLPVEAAFALCSAVSMALVVSYLRLVVSSSFAWREAAFAQAVYLIGFSLAHFWEGFTGLTVTVLAILTLFVLMQLTGRVRWSSVLGATAVRLRRRCSPSRKTSEP